MFEMTERNGNGTVVEGHVGNRDDVGGITCGDGELADP